MPCHLRRRCALCAHLHRIAFNMVNNIRTLHRILGVCLKMSLTIHSYKCKVRSGFPSLMLRGLRPKCLRGSAEPDTMHPGQLIAGTDGGHAFTKLQPCSATSYTSYALLLLSTENSNPVAVLYICTGRFCCKREQDAFFLGSSRLGC